VRLQGQMSKPPFWIPLASARLRHALTRTQFDAQPTPMLDSEPVVPPPRGSGVAFITGVSGFLGGAAADAFRRAGWRVAGFGRATRPTGQYELWATGDVDRSILACAAGELGAPEFVFHCAGGSSVGASVANPEADFVRTVLSVRETLAFLCACAPAARLIFPSSAAVYGANSTRPIIETAPPQPISPYGRHKLQAEMEIGAAVAEFGLQAVILRFFSLYGPGLRKQLLWDMATRLAEGHTRLEFSGTGNELRDFLFVQDAVRLVGIASDVKPTGAPLILNGGRGEAVSVRRAVETMARAFRREVPIGFSGTARSGDPAALVADISKARALGFTPQVGFEAGVGALSQWFAALPASATA